MSNTIKVTLGDELTERIKAEAAKKYIPVSTLVRMAVAEYLSRHTRGKKATENK